MGNTKYIAKWSGGANSTVMIFELIKRGMPLDYILFNDTGYEFEIMYQYVHFIRNKLSLDYNIKPILNNTSERAKRIYDGWLYGKYTRGAKEGRVRGWPKQHVPLPWCRRLLKIEATDLWVEENCKGQKVEYYLGYTKEEHNRMVLKDGFSYPLALWGYGSDECLCYLMENGIWNPLYDYFDRTGCYLCHLQGKDSFRTIYKHFPAEWAEIKSIENKLIKMNAANIEITHGYTTDLLEKEWAEEERLKAEAPEQMALF